MYMKLKDGKSKVLTLSYDDGVVQDIRLIGILDKYGIVWFRHDHETHCVRAGQTLFL